MKSKPVNISWGPQVQKRALQIIKARGFKGVSDLLQTLIREEYERRHAPVIARDILDSLTDEDGDDPPEGEAEKPRPPKRPRQPGTS